MAEQQKKTWATTGRGNRTKAWSAELEVFSFADHKGKYVQVRLVTQSITERLHWPYLDVKNAVKHAKGVKLNFKQAPGYPVVCPDFDPINETGTPNKCPICVHFGSHVRTSLNYYCWAYVGVPSKKQGGVVRWLDEPVVLKLGTAIIIGIQNVVNLRGGVDPADPKKGYIINIMSKENSTGPNDMYSVQVGEAMALTKAQRAAVDELPDLMESYKPTNPADIKTSLQQKGYYDLLDGSDAEDEDDEDEDEDEKKSSKKSKSKKSRDDDEDSDDDDADDDEDDDDENEKPSKKSKLKAKSKKSRDEDEDEDDEDEDEDERKPSKKSKSKKSRYDDDDEDSEDEEESDEDEEDEDEEDEKKSSKKSKSKSKKSKDEDDEDDDGDEDDIPLPRNSTAAKKLAANKSKSKLKSKSKKSKDEDEDDD